MLKISDVRLASRYDCAGLRQAAAEFLDVPITDINDLQIHKLSIDARRKPDVRFVYTLLVSLENEGSHEKSGVSIYAPPEPYAFPSSGLKCPKNPPVVVGTGPAGLFSALCLSEAGVKCIVLERGQPIEQRAIDVERFWSGGGLDSSSNVQFGEGGAGAFSDGKLTTGVNDKRIRYVLERLVRFGAPDDILYLSKPHIGTDRLRNVVIAIRERLIELGCDIRFGHRLTEVDIRNGALNGITVELGGSSYSLKADSLVLAPGNSARDTFEMLLRRGLMLSPKEFSVGVRVEHLQREMEFSQYGRYSVSGAAGLPASDYKMAVHLEGGRSVYTFCVCPGGQVVAAASEPGLVVTNGMSLYARAAENISGALLVTVTPDDFGRNPLDGMAFQRRLEHAAFIAGGGDYCAPAQFLGDFLEKRASTGRAKKITPTYLPGVRLCDLWNVLPEFVCEALREAIPEFAARVAAFSEPYAILTAVESRSSCPVRIEREGFEAVGIRGIFPCGEGSGYAGGIMSAAVDGIKCAEAIASRLLCE